MVGLEAINSKSRDALNVGQSMFFDVKSAGYACDRLTSYNMYMEGNVFLS